MKSFYKIIAAAFLMLFTVQCEVIDSSLLDSPNAVSPENVDADFLLTNIQLQTRGIYSGAALRGSQLTRQRRLFGSTYDNALQSQFLNGVYQTTYANVFVDVQTLTPLAEENELFFHLGIAQTLQAYGMITMVDMFGDVPFSEALDPGNFNPGLDDDASVYQAALSLLDTAIQNLQNEDRLTFPTDLYFPGETGDDKVEAWVRVANTLKLKAYLNMRHVDEAAATAGINTVLSDAIGPITEPEHDFTFQYSTNPTNPDSRHPLFTNNYLNGANDYIGLSIMHIMLTNKGNVDPRMRYYFYRQRTENTTDVNEQSCLNAIAPTHYTDDDPFCQLEDGYWGNGHLNTEGIPPDQFARTTFGIYPAGGEFDAKQAADVADDLGLEGAGIRPILMSSFTHFMLAEAAETMTGVNTPMSALGHLQEAARQSIETVRAFGAGRVAELEVEALEPDDDDIDDYVSVVETNYNMDPIRTIAIEFYIASFPNGMEAYNLMRRTGFPEREDGIQPSRNASPGDFYRSLPYAANMINRNSNISAKSSNLVRVFWDTRGDDTEFNF